jgi:hypothetical protein
VVGRAVTRAETAKRELAECRKNHVSNRSALEARLAEAALAKTRAETDLAHARAVIERVDFDAAESFAKYHAEHAGYGGVSREFHMRACSFLRSLRTLLAPPTTEEI